MAPCSGGGGVLGSSRFMKRLVITGLPCPSSTWERFLGERPGQRIIPIREVFENCDSPDPRQMSRYITREMERFRPDSILCHDIGVPLALLSLLRLQRRDTTFRPRVTMFNGAFRRVNLLKANHMIRMQFMTKKRAIADVLARGGSVDLELKQHMPRIRAMYRLMVMFRIGEQISHALGLDELLGLGGERRLKTPIQVIASPDDPYLPIETVRRLGEDVAARRYHEVSYGHFPYSVPRERILPLVEEFESHTV